MPQNPAVPFRKVHHPLAAKSITPAPHNPSVSRLKMTSCRAEKSYLFLWEKSSLQGRFFGFFRADFSEKSGAIFVLLEWRREKNRQEEAFFCLKARYEF